MGVSLACISVHLCIQYPQRPEIRFSELELRTVVSGHMGTGNRSPLQTANDFKSSLAHQLLHSFNFCLSDKPKDRVCLSLGIALSKSWTLFRELLGLSLPSVVYSRVSVMAPLFKTYACYFNPSAIDNIGPLMFQVKHQENTQRGWQHWIFAE